MSSQVFRFPNRGNRGAMRGRQNVNRGGRSPRIPASPKMVFTKEFVNTIEHSFVSSGGHSFSVLEGYEASAAKRIISLSVDIIVTGKVVVGDKYAANIAVGVRISDETPRNIGEVTKLHSYKVVSLPAKGQISIKPVLPGKQSCDLTDDDSELYVVCYADVDTVDGFDDPVGTMEIRTVIVYEPSPEQEWS